MPSLEIQYDQIPLTRLGMTETLLGLAFAHCISSISDGFCVNWVYNMGHDDGSDVCRHHILVSDTRRLMFWFARIACLVCYLHFRHQRPNYNREKALQAGLYLNTRFLRRNFALWGANVRHENESTLVKILEVTSHSKGQP